MRPPPRGEADDMRLTVIYNIIHVGVTENIYQLHYLVTAVPPENRTTRTNSQQFYAKIITANIDT